MIITISGALGSGKSTVAKLIAKKFNLKHYSTGDFMRKIAAEKGITLLELVKLAETDNSIDKELDNRQEKIGKEEDNFIIDARLAWNFMPHSIKIFLDVSDEEAAKRIFKERRKDEKYNIDLNSTLENIKKRRQSEIKRYQKYYNVNYFDHYHYDLVVDTTNISIEKVVDKIIKFIKERIKNEN